MKCILFSGRHTTASNWWMGWEDSFPLRQNAAHVGPLRPQEELLGIPPQDTRSLFITPFPIFSLFAQTLSSAPPAAGVVCLCSCVRVVLLYYLCVCLCVCVWWSLKCLSYGCTAVCHSDHKDLSRCDGQLHGFLSFFVRTKCAQVLLLSG